MDAAHDGEYGELVDPFLENQYEPYEMARMVACAAAAVRHSGRRRPKMSQVNNKFISYYQKSTCLQFIQNTSFLILESLGVS